MSTSDLTTSPFLTREVVAKYNVKLLPLMVIVLPGFFQASCYDLLLYGLRQSAKRPWAILEVKTKSEIVFTWFSTLDDSTVQSKYHDLLCCSSSVKLTVGSF